MLWPDRRFPHDLGIVPRLLSVSLLLLPAAVLGGLAVRLSALPLAAGAGVQLLFVLVFLRVFPVWRPPVSASIIILYLIALGWAWLPTRGSTDWAVHVAQGILLLGAVGLLALHDLTRTGAEPLRRANKWSRRVAARSHWPLPVSECRTLPEVDGLREAVREEAGPALALLSDPRPQVQAAALGALEYRPYWQPGEAELVLKVGKAACEPAVRVAAAYALAGVRSAELIAGLAGFLRDPSAEVRHAAAESLLWDGEVRWPFARDAVRDALADRKLQADGPLFVGAARLPAAAIADLTTWAAEHAPLSHRAVQTLIEQYDRGLLDPDRPELASELVAQMLSPDTAPGLRIELAALLRDHHRLGPNLLDRMTNLDQPGPMRLFAAEVMLRMNPNDPDGVDVLRGLARQPNRELAVQVAVVLQSVLGLDLGLPPGGQAPIPTSKAAGEVTRRVLAWANGATPELLRSGTGSHVPLRPTVRPTLAGSPTTAIIPASTGERPRGSNTAF